MSPTISRTFDPRYLLEGVPKRDLSNLFSAFERLHSRKLMNETPTVKITRRPPSNWEGFEQLSPCKQTSLRCLRSLFRFSSVEHLWQRPPTGASTVHFKEKTRVSSFDVVMSLYKRPEMCGTITTTLSPVWSGNPGQMFDFSTKSIAELTRFCNKEWFNASSVNPLVSHHAWWQLLGFLFVKILDWAACGFTREMPFIYLFFCLEWQDFAKEKTLWMKRVALTLKIFSTH